ncbi:hypothetical protein [Stigmatella aurantiaca]|uniref:Conserved uncharacterized protein n=1 Tax=Stigmatella aurantiaca (strain DW4/3-1) TaxID=378806 RepID=E3FMK2_STIAD|nr:hypothetical protein [Stigmatella aurantiaca]ADO70595.1 conserved uncharacterized protein [Stigmatella aurantiaca DW4/3-1]
MKRLTALCCLIFVGCATAPMPRTLLRLSEDSNARTDSPVDVAEPVRVETRAGTFLVSPGHAEDFLKLLAGEPTPIHFYAGAEP